MTKRPANHFTFTFILHLHKTDNRYTHLTDDKPSIFLPRSYSNNLSHLTRLHPLPPPTPMAPPRPKTPSSLHRSSRPTKAGPEQYPEAEIGIVDKEPRPSRTKTPSRRHHHHRPPPNQPIEVDAEAEAEGDAQEVEKQIEDLLGLAEATIPTREDPPSPNQWARFFANRVRSAHSVISSSSCFLSSYPALPAF